MDGHHFRLRAALAALLLCTAGSPCSAVADAAEPGRTAPPAYRLYDGITAFVNNPEGRDFRLTLDVRDINIYETGPREVLVKVYDPDGRTVVRQVIPDDGVTSRAYQPPMGAWDHEAWYYAHCYMQGAEPMIRWSAFSAPDRLASVPKRTLTYSIPGGVKGVWKVLVVGAIDHYVTLTIDPTLPYAVSGHCDWLHGHGDLYRKSYLYVPRGARGLYLIAAEYDLPRTRRLVLKSAAGKPLFEGDISTGFVKAQIDFEAGERHDDEVMTLEISAGAGDFLIGVKWRLEKDPEVVQRGERAVAAVLAQDPQTAMAVRGGAIYHDGRVFWQMYQVRFHQWLETLKPADFEVRDTEGRPVEPAPSTEKTVPARQKSEQSPASLPSRPGFVALNGPYWRPPLCDRIMYHYPAHRNRAALHVAIRDLAAGLRAIGPNDHVAVTVGGPFGNMGYEFSNYAWHYWRPAWRIAEEPDAPESARQLVREAMLVCGDRLAFCRSWERINGNAFAQVLSALRYSYAATGDPLQKGLFETYWQRFVSGGWGDRVGVGPSGPVQEGFAYAYHYGSYILTTWPSVIGDFDDERFRQVHERIRTWFSYTLADEQLAAGPWSARTHHYPHWKIEPEGRFAWKGLPGPDFTVSVNGADEWFAARRRNYYVLTYHGRLSPKSSSNANAGQAGYGGGMLCQVHVPGRGPVIASSLNGSYGEGMHPSQWRDFHIHSLVGQTADGRPLVAGDSEHPNARLKGVTVTSSGEVRESSVRSTRSYTFGDSDITCEVRLKETDYHDVLNLWVKSPMRGKVAEAYEMIPFVPAQPRRPGTKKPQPTAVTAIGSDGNLIGPLTESAVTAKTVVIDRGGFGVRVELEQRRPVVRGQRDTVLVRLTDGPAPAGEIGLRYRLLPYGAGE